MRRKLYQGGTSKQAQSRFRFESTSDSPLKSIVNAFIFCLCLTSYRTTCILQRMDCPLVRRFLQYLIMFLCSFTFSRSRFILSPPFVSSESVHAVAFSALKKNGFCFNIQSSEFGFNFFFFFFVSSAVDSDFLLVVSAFFFCLCPSFRFFFPLVFFFNSNG